MPETHVASMPTLALVQSLDISVVFVASMTVVFSELPPFAYCFEAGGAAAESRDWPRATPHTYTAVCSPVTTASENFVLFGMNFRQVSNHHERTC